MIRSMLANLTGLSAGPSKTRRGGGRHQAPPGQSPAAPSTAGQPRPAAPKAAPSAASPMAAMDTHLSKALATSDPVAKRRHLFNALTAHNRATKAAGPAGPPLVPAAPAAADPQSFPTGS